MQRSVYLGTLVNLASSPSITQYAANGTGTVSVNAATVALASTGNTLTFTYSLPQVG